MQPHKMIIGLLLFSAFIFGGIFILYGDISNPDIGLLEEYDVSKDAYASELENLTNVDSRIEEVYNTSSDQKDDTFENIDTTTQWSIIDIGPVKAMRRMFNYFRGVNILVMSIGGLLHIPSFMLITITTIILVVVTFMVIYFLMKFQLRND